MKNLKDLNAEDNMLILKAVKELAEATYKANSTYILNRILKEGKNYKSENDFGTFEKRHNEATTVAEALSKKQEDIIKLQNEIEALKKLDKNAIYTEDKTTLVCKHSQIATDIAKDLLQELTANLSSKRIDNLMVKVSKQKARK